MERLTYRSTKFNNPVSYGACEKIKCSAKCDSCKINDLIAKLCAYEETGLEPEEIYEVRFLIAAQRDTKKLARLRELVLADQNGRMLVLPCKAGEYWRDWNGERVRIESVSFSQSRMHLCNTDMVTYRYDDGEDDFAVNWIYFKSHFTREEAEAALKVGDGHA